MSLVLNRPLSNQREIEYPTSDGQPMAENTLQYEYLTTIKDNLEILYANDPHVFIAGDLLWYPVEGDNRTRQAPDVFVAFGRPKGYRGSYQQWEEGNIPPQVVFEILSSGNRVPTRREGCGEMARKFYFYQQYGVEEYYIYDPERHDLAGWLRNDSGLLEPIEPMDNWVSPRLSVRFDISGSRLILFGPDGQPFLNAVDRERVRQQVQQERDDALQRAERLATRLRALGIDPDNL